MISDERLEYAGGTVPSNAKPVSAKRLAGFTSTGEPKYQTVKTFGYDGHGRKETETAWQSLGQVNAKGYTTIYRYFPADGPVTKTSVTLANGHVSSTELDTQCFNYDESRRLTQAWTPNWSPGTVASASMSGRGARPTASDSSRLHGDEVRVVQWPCMGTADQQVRIEYLEGSSYVLSVFTRGTDGTVRETKYTPGTGWRTSDWTAAAAANGFGTIRFAGDPAGFSFGSERHVFGADADGRLSYLWWSPGDAKVHGDRWPGTITGTPVAFVWGRVQMVYARGSNGNLHRWWWQASDPRVVQRADLGASVGAGAVDAPQLRYVVSDDRTAWRQERDRGRCLGTDGFAVVLVDGGVAGGMTVRFDREDPDVVTSCQVASPHRGRYCRRRDDCRRVERVGRDCVERISSRPVHGGERARWRTFRRAGPAGRLSRGS